jgi:hypothetical protein
VSAKDFLLQEHPSALPVRSSVLAVLRSVGLQSLLLLGPALVCRRRDSGSALLWPVFGVEAALCSARPDSVLSVVCRSSPSAR